jgi:hypothetical protein
MTEHLTFRQVKEYLAKRLPAQQIPGFHEHAEGCSACREMLVASVIGCGDEHLSEQQAVDFVAGLLAAEENGRVAEHLGSCPSCTATVADLEEFRQSDQLGGATAEVPEAPIQRRPHIIPANNWARLLPIAAALLAVAGASLWLVHRPGHTEAKVMAQLRDATGLLQLNHTGVITAPALPPAAAGLIAGAMRTGRLPEGPAALVTDPPETLRSSSGSLPSPALKIVSPVGIRVVSDRPEFRWNPLRGAASWQIKVFDENFNEIARSGVIHGGPGEAAVWVPEAALPRQRSLLWQVTEIRNGARITAPAPPEPSPRFEIISAEAARQITEARATSPPSHLLLAILYSQAGLRREAASEIEALSSLNPGSALASSLRGSLRP